MNTYVVHKILQHGSLQLLLVRPNDYDCHMCIYDEHTGTTLMRMTNCTIEEFKRAIKLLESSNA